MTAPHVSVVVPSYNHARFIEETLRSIFAQTWRPMDLLVLDDGSTDDSVSVIERVLRDAPFPARLVARENRGLTKTLNEGLAASRGEYFAYLGSDDTWEPTRLARGVAALEHAPRAVMAFSHCYFIDQRSVRVDVSSRSRQHASGDYLWPMLRGVVGIMSPTPLFRAGVLRETRWNEDAKLEDFDLYLNLALRGPFEFIDAPLASWRFHETNTSAGWSFMLRERLATVERIAVKLKLREPELNALRERIHFEEAGALLASGQRLGAAWESLKHWRGAKGVRDWAKRAAWLAAPRFLVEWRRQQVRRRSSGA